MARMTSVLVYSWSDIALGETKLQKCLERTTYLEAAEIVS